MEILESDAGHAVVVHVTGRVNSVNAPQFGERLAAMIARGCRAIVIDLSRLEHITSAGFRSLLRADKQAEERQATVVLFGLGGLTLELFELGGFLEMFNVALTRDEAVQRASAVLQRG